MVNDTPATHRDYQTDIPTLRYRLLGLLPLLFFILHANYYRETGGLPHMLWMCNIGNLMLAIGMFLDHRELIRAAAIWTIPEPPPSWPPRATSS